MQPIDRSCFCARCSQTVHDLSKLTAQEVDSLLKAEKSPCVRARIGANGAFVVKDNPKRGSLALPAAIASVGLLASACQITANSDAPRGNIVGQVDTTAWQLIVAAVGSDGRKHRTRVRNDGTYRIKNLPYDSYALEFIPDCGERWSGGQVIVRGVETQAEKATDPNQCIVIGMIERQEPTVG